MSNMDPNFGGGNQGMGGSTTTPDQHDLTHRVSDAAHQAKQRAADIGRNAAQSFEKGKDSAVQTLQNTASKIRSTAPQSGRVGAVANRAADTIDRTATYMRDHDMRDMMGDVEGVVRRNPGPSLLVAAAFGFLIGSAIRGGRNRY